MGTFKKEREQKGNKMNATEVTITSPLEIAGFIRTNGTNCQFISLKTVTEPKLKKTCPYVGVKKISKRNGILNMHFAPAVARRVAAALGMPENEVEYVPGETWYEHEQTGDGKPLPLVHHKEKQGELYLQYFPLKNLGTVYMDDRGEEIPEELLKPHFYARKDSEFKPAVCVFKLTSIAEIRANGFALQTVDTEAVDAILSAKQ